jgi:hypothetical protein
MHNIYVQWYVTYVHYNLCLCLSLSLALLIYIYILNIYINFTHSLGRVHASYAHPNPVPDYTFRKVTQLRD